MTTHRADRNLKGLLLPLGLLALWLGLTLTGTLPSYVLPTPDHVGKAAVELWRDQGLLKEAETTLLRVAEGFLIGSFLGFALGAAMGVSRTVEKIFVHSFHLYRQVPLPGWIPILVIAFGNTELSKIVFIVMGAFPAMALNTHVGIRSVSRKLIEVGQVLGFGPVELFWKVILPAALPHIWTGFKVSLNMAWMFVIAAELMTFSAGGLGSLLDGARDQFRMDIILVLIVLIGILGFLMNQGLEKTQQLLLKNRRFN